MDMHEEIRSLLEPFILKDLPQDQADEVRRHLDECSDCRNHADRLKKILDGSDRLRQIHADHTTIQIARERLFQAIDKVPMLKPQQPIWRKIMSSRLFKISTAAAVILAVSLLLFWPGESLTPKVYGITDIPKLLQSAQTLDIRGWMYLHDVKEADGSPKKLPVRYQFDLINNRFRISHNAISTGPQGIVIKTGDLIFDGLYSMNVNHNDKTVVYTKNTPFNRRLRTHQLCKLFTDQLVRPDRLSGFKKMGQTLINNHLCDYWAVEFNAGMPLKMEIWLNPATGDLEKMQTWVRDQNKWQQLHEILTFQRNIKLNPDTFSTVPPTGYILKNTKETAPFEEIGDGGVEYCGINLQKYFSFSLPGGSIIFVWNCVEGNPPQSQDLLFKNLTFGGPLAKLPVEIYALKPMGSDRKVLYTGYHLAFTKKGNKYYEWGLYIPNQPAGSKDVVGYEALYRFNPAGRNLKWKISLTVQPLFTLDSENAFNTWISDALVELSDPNTAPSNVTWSAVQKLIQDEINSRKK